MSHEPVIVVHVPASAGERWKTTLAIPDAASVAVADSVTVPARFAPGSSSVTLGAAVSTWTVADAAEVASLPTRSELRTR